jgi:hypothetical protein
VPQRHGPARGKLTARHVGRRISEDEDLNAVFSDEARRADDRALLLKVRDVVKHSLDEAVFTAAVDKMRGLDRGQGDGRPGEGCRGAGEEVGATESERGGISAR